MDDQKPVMFSFIIPVLNESDKINTLIKHIHAQNSNGNYEIIVVDGDPHHDTINAIDDKDVITITSQVGRARQMNAGAAIARGDILIFLHADTELPQNAPDKIRRVLEQDGYVAGAFDLGIKSHKYRLKIVEFGANFRTHITGIPYGDQAIFVRKDYFNRICGYSDIPLMEDIELMSRIKRMSGRIHLLPERVKTSPRRWEREGVVYCTLRNWMLAILYSCGVAPEKLKKFFKYGNYAYKR